MTEHLPECPVHGFVPPPTPEPLIWPRCICDRLRACEQRVRDEYVDTFVWADGKRVGVQAARDAVAALPWFRPVHRSDVLHAIDALRGVS